MAGGGKSEKQSQISVTRALKFITFCCSEMGEDESRLDFLFRVLGKWEIPAN
jgi:hypothetical protein